MGQKWTVSLDARLMSNSSGETVDETHSQSQLGVGIYRRFLTTAFLFARVPYAVNTLETEGQSKIEKSGLGDVELLAGNEFRTSFLGFHPALTLGLKLPTGKNDFEGEVVAHQHSTLDHGDTEGARLPEHAQLGTGSVDGLVMAHLRRGVHYRWQATLGYRVNGENNVQYQYGNVTWLDVTVARNLAPAFSLSGGVRARLAEKDSDRGVTYDESGGALGAALIEATYQFTSHLRASLFTAIPVVNNLNGSQEESPVITAGFSGSF